jgi:hypothetical protein
MKPKVIQIDSRNPIQRKRKAIIPQVILARETETVGVRTEIERTPKGNGYIETHRLIITTREKSKRRRKADSNAAAKRRADAKAERAA